MRSAFMRAERFVNNMLRFGVFRDYRDAKLTVEKHQGNFQLHKLLGARCKDVPQVLADLRYVLMYALQWQLSDIWQLSGYLVVLLG